MANLTKNIAYSNTPLAFPEYQAIHLNFSPKHNANYYKAAPGPLSGCIPVRRMRLSRFCHFFGRHPGTGISSGQQDSDRSRLRVSSQDGVFTVCKEASDDPSVGFQFDVSARIRSTDPPEITTYDPYFIADMECVDVHTSPPSSPRGDEVTITEVVPAGWVLDGVTIYSLDLDRGDSIRTTHEETGPTIVGVIEDQKLGCVAVYRNSKVGGGEGCTPGAWKNRLRRIGAWVPTGYSTGDLVNSVFIAPSTFDGTTLLQALSLQGGNSFDEKVEILLRAGTAALLNAAHPDVSYDLSPQGVIDAVNAAIASGNLQTVVDVAGQLDDFNNQGCDITSG